MAENEHIHDDNCGCGEDEDLGTVTLTLEDDKEVECAIFFNLSCRRQSVHCSSAAGRKR